jgi:sugar transferase EpsL
MIESFYREIGKRVVDLGLTVPLFVFLLPLMGVIALLVRLKLGSPVLFQQQRPGLDGQLFTLFKFRSMRDARDANDQLLPDGERLTSFGKFLRRTSLDELPELFNVLKGEMSLVGPRPLLRQYLPRYSPQQGRRHRVKPGVTGWSQVNGRNALPWEEKFKLDVWYVENLSFPLDLRILGITFIKVFRREGINAEGYVTMPEFTRLSEITEQK